MPSATLILESVGILPPDEKRVVDETKGAGAPSPEHPKADVPGYYLPDTSNESINSYAVSGLSVQGIWKTLA